MTLTTRVAKVYNALFLNPFKPEIEKMLRKNQKGFWEKSTHNIIDSNNPTNYRSRWKKSQSDTIVCRFLQSIWFHTKKKDEANTSNLQPPQRILSRPWLGHLAFVPDGLSKSMADSRPKGFQLQLGHLRVGKLQHWHLCPLCIALDLAV